MVYSSGVNIVTITGGKIIHDQPAVQAAHSLSPKPAKPNLAEGPAASHGATVNGWFMVDMQDPTTY